MAVPEDTGFPLTWFKNKASVRDMWECAVCHEVVKDPVQIRGCGHQFCRYCLDNVLKTQTKCPSCQDDVSKETVFDDKAANRAIRKLEVNCPSNGCEWDGRLNTFLKVHLQICPNTVIKCMFSEFGCEHMCRRCQLEDHLEKSMKSHLDLSMTEVSRLGRVTATIPPIMIITDFNRKLFKAKEGNMSGRIEGDPFYTSTHGYKLRMVVQINETEEEYKDHLGVYIRVMKSEHDAILSWPFKKKCTFTLIDQQDDEEERKNIVHTLTPEGQDSFKKPREKENTGCGFPSFVSHATLRTRKYIKDDTVFITVSIEQ